jgi:hypothetical protein
VLRILRTKFLNFQFLIFNFQKISNIKISNKNTKPAFAGFVFWQGRMIIRPRLDFWRRVGLAYVLDSIQK